MRVERMADARSGAVAVMGLKRLSTQPHLAHAAHKSQQEAGLEQLVAVDRRRHRVRQVLELHPRHALRAQRALSNGCRKIQTDKVFGVKQS